MGYFLLRESMFDSVIVARDRWLKEGGAMFPSHAKMYLAPIRTQTSAKKREEFEDSCVGWDEFADETLQNYGVDMRSLTETFEQEQREFFLNTSAWVDVHPSQVLGAPCVLRDFDLHTVTLEEMRNLDVPFNLRVMEAAGRRARGGWRVLRMVRRQLQGQLGQRRDGRRLPPRRTRTAPHWGQQAFYLDPTLSAADATSSPVGSSSAQGGEPAPVRFASHVEAGRGRGGFRGQRGNRRAVQRVAHQ